MKLGIGVILVIVLISLIHQSSQEDYDDTRIVQADFNTVSETYKELEPTDDAETQDEVPKRRLRPGKRRRRMRKRTTTPEPVEETQIDVENAEPPEIARKIPEDHTVIDEEQVTKRRPGKRRRRPYRRYQDEDGDTKLPRRRRKGSRKKRPEKIEITTLPMEIEEIEHFETTSETLELEPSQPKEFLQIHEQIQTEVQTEKPHQEKIEEITKRPSNRDTTETSTQAVEFGNKIFDRRNLFSKSKRLPPTSAVLRRKSYPNKNSTGVSHLRMISPLANLESELDKNRYKNEITPGVPEGFTARPEIIEAKKLLTTMRMSTTPVTTTEEPNYPRFESKKNVVTESEEFYETTIEPEIITEDIQNDNVIELLNSDNSAMLKKILQSRNMTLDELLEHRERGSSNFHLLDIFKEIEPVNNSEIIETEETKRVTTEPIQFPDQEVLGSFPKFLMDQIENHVQKKENKTKSDNREARVFESMPEFTTSRPKPFSNWRVIANPNLKPVSIHGDYEEIKISDTSKDKEIHQVYLLDENQNLILHKNRLPSTFSVETTKSQPNLNFNFKRIPVTVKSAIIISGVILAITIFVFLSILISCRLRQKKARLRAKQDVLCEHLQNEDFMNSQQSLSPVLQKHKRNVPNFNHGIHSNPNSNRHYYLWRTLRKKFQYE